MTAGTLKIDYRHIAFSHFFPSARLTATRYSGEKTVVKRISFDNFPKVVKIAIFKAVVLSMVVGN